MITEVPLIFLGSILTVLALLTVEGFKDKRSRTEIRKGFILFAKLELQAIEKTLEKLKNSLDNKQYYDYLLTSSLSESVQNLQKIRKEAIYLDNINLQEKYIDLLTDLSFFSTNLNGLEKFYDDQKSKISPILIENGKEVANTKPMEDLNRFVIQKRTEMLIELIDIKRRVEDIVKIFDQ